MPGLSNCISEPQVSAGPGTLARQSMLLRWGRNIGSVPLLHESLGAAANAPQEMCE